jgi:general secretion pathway protein L
MPKTTLGIQIGPTQAIAVHLKGGWKAASVDRVVRLDLSQIPLEERGPALLEAELPHADSVISALPADAVFQRLVELPFSDRTKVEQAAPLEAEESLPLPLEDLICHVQMLERDAHHSKVLLAAAPEARLSALVQELTAGGVPPQLVDVEPLALAAVARRSTPVDKVALLVDLSDRLCQALLLAPAGPMAFHAFSSGGPGSDLLPELGRYLQHWSDPLAVEVVFLSGPRAADQDLRAWSTELGLPVDLLPFPSDGTSGREAGPIPWPGWAIPLGLALREGYARNASQINLLQGPFAPNRESGPWKRAAAVGGIYAGVLLALWGVGVWSQASYKNAQYEALKSSVREEFRQALPDVTNIVSEVDQMKVRVDQLETRAASLGSLVDREVSPLRILREVSERIPKDQEVELRDFAVEENRVRLEGITTGFDAIDKITADLSAYPRFTNVQVTEAKVAVERDKVQFKLTISLGRKG